jgi:hypothetical protein
MVEAPDRFVSDINQQIENHANCLTFIGSTLIGIALKIVGFMASLTLAVLTSPIWLITTWITARDPQQDIVVIRALSAVRPEIPKSLS